MPGALEVPAFFLYHYNCFNFASPPPVKLRPSLKKILGPGPAVSAVQACDYLTAFFPQINPNSGVCNEDHLSYFKFIGKYRYRFSLERVCVWACVSLWVCSCFYSCLAAGMHLHAF